MDDNKQMARFDPKQPITFNITESALQEIERRWSPELIPSDLSVKDNYVMVKNGVAECRSLRSKVEQRRKELKADAMAFGRKVDATAGEIKDRLLAVETPMKDAKTEYDTKKEIEKREKIRKEEERVQGIADRIAKTRALVEAHISADSVTIKSAMESVESDIPEEWAQEFTEKAKVAKTETLAKLRELYTMKQQSEQAAEQAKRAEAERLAKEEADRKAREEEAARVAKENAAKQAELEKEKAALEAERQKFEKQRLEAARAEQEKERAAKAKEEEERKAKEEAERKAAEEAVRKGAIAKEEEAKKQDKKEVDKRKKEALKGLEVYVEKEIAKAVLGRIVAGKIPHVHFE